MPTHNVHESNTQSAGGAQVTTMVMAAEPAGDASRAASAVMGEASEALHEESNSAEAAASPAAAGTGAGGGGGGSVLIAEAKKYRKRAQAAEQMLDQLKAALAQHEQALAEREKTIRALEQRQQIDELLREEQAIDHEAAHLLTELAVSQMTEPDVAAAVDELCQQRPYLFRQQAGRNGSGVMSAMDHNDASGADDAQDAAIDASITGSRRDLLRYLRLRRAPRHA